MFGGLWARNVSIGGRAVADRKRGHEIVTRGSKQTVTVPLYRNHRGAHRPIGVRTHYKYRYRVYRVHDILSQSITGGQGHEILRSNAYAALPA